MPSYTSVVVAAYALVLASSVHGENPHEGFVHQKRQVTATGSLALNASEAAASVPSALAAGPSALGSPAAGAPSAIASALATAVPSAPAPVAAPISAPSGAATDPVAPAPASPAPAAPAVDPVSALTGALGGLTGANPLGQLTGLLGGLTGGAGAPSNPVSGLLSTVTGLLGGLVATLTSLTGGLTGGLHARAAIPDYSAEIIQLEAVLSLLKKTLAVHANVKVSA